MSKLALNPVHFAAKEIRDLIANFGDFTSTETEDGLQNRRLMLENDRDFSLIRRMSDVMKNTTSIFRHSPTSSLVVLFEHHDGGEDNPDWTSGIITVKATTMEALTRAIFASAGGERAVERYLTQRSMDQSTDE
jgi:hypothetical protein